MTHNVLVRNLPDDAYELLRLIAFTTGKTYAEVIAQALNKDGHWLEVAADLASHIRAPSNSGLHDILNSEDIDALERFSDALPS